MSDFPRTAQLDVEGSHFLVLQPVLEAIGDKLRTVIASNVLWCSITGDDNFRQCNDIHGPDRLYRMRGQIFPRVIVEQGQDAEVAAIIGLVSHEVPASELAGLLGPLPLRLRESPRRFILRFFLVTLSPSSRRRRARRLAR